VHALILFLVLCTAHQEPPKPRIQIILEDSLSFGGWQQARTLFLAEVRKLAADEADLEQRRLDLNEHRQLCLKRGYGTNAAVQAWRRLKEESAESIFTLSYITTGSAYLWMHGLDGATGIQVGRGLKIRSIEKQELSEEHLKAFQGSIAEFSRSFLDQRDKRSRFAETAYRETIRWLDDEDPAHLGFRWDYRKAGNGMFATVVDVYDGAPIKESGLRIGDRIVAVDGAATPVPALFGKAMLSLRTGQEVRFSIEREESRVEIAATAMKSSEIVPRHEGTVIGRTIPTLVADVGAEPVAISLETVRGRVTVLFVFKPQENMAWQQFSTLCWWKDGHPKADVTIAGVSIATRAQSQSFLDLSKLPFPLVADEDRVLSDELHAVQLPAVLLFDRRGILRFRQALEVDLQHALLTLLAEPAE